MKQPEKTAAYIRARVGSSCPWDKVLLPLAGKEFLYFYYYGKGTGYEQLY